MPLQLSMVILEVRDLDASLTFYRLVGLDFGDPIAGRPVAVHRMPSGVSLLLTTSFASQYDREWTRPLAGYQQILEFYVGGDDTVDSTWAKLTGAGYHGRLPPTKTAGPYAAMVDDPDGNVLLIASDRAGLASR